MVEKKKITAFDTFVEEVGKKFEKMETLISERLPTPAKDETGDFKLLKENYDKKFEGVSDGLTSLKELITGVTDKIEKHRNTETDTFLDLFLGF